MKQNVAPTSLSIKLVTSLILLITGGLFIGAFFTQELLWAGTILAIIVLVCYFSAPIAYELNGNQLFIISRAGRKVFGPVQQCTLIGEEKPSFSLRLWGNGGLFAGTGIFWNKRYGVFRAYVTTGEKAALTLIETPGSKIIITPESPEEFLAYANASGSVNG